MASSSSLLHCCVLVLACLLSSHSSQALGGNNRDKAWHIVEVKSLLPSSVCSSAKEKGFNRLTIIHRHGPCTPQPTNKKITDAQILRKDQDRVDSMHYYVKSAKKATIGESLSVSLPAQHGSSYGTGNYVVKIGMGTPRKDFSVVFDTGSDLSWIQCKPCKACYNPTDPPFDPTLSSTYSNVSCSSKDCTRLEKSFCSNRQCQYEVRYLDNSTTNGLLARDTLTLSPTDRLLNFIFGCGTNNSGFSDSDMTDGLIGLGRDRVSLISQASSKYGAMFSYCLPSNSSFTGYLSIGTNSVPKASFTSMVRKTDSPSFYYINLIALKVGGKLLNISSTVFSAGTVIDSGTVITRLPPTAYVKLRDAFQQYMEMYPRAPNLDILDTCYDLSKYREMYVPAIAFVFSDGTTLDVVFSGILYVPQESQACLAFAGNSDDSDIGIIGNMQQKTVNVIYDIANHKIGFSYGGCK
ncbi:Eukaryotic aspartyl protease family protein [Rhynchospora pubera]|uniref:Eukaryotic aspartyl protease family protein n=1 Tax=Rhynchospora pubera TaxID=906938 RepID=A0AAV8G5Y3_9POAL|nr:Eukaryotic aspartyl protease family protein [Rhynchospora pubera]